VSIGARVPIVATVTTLLFMPVMNKAGNMLGHSVQAGSKDTIRCVKGKPIAATPKAKRLGLNGKTCKSQIVRRVRIAPPAT
jgi:hypothetical protein